MDVTKLWDYRVVRRESEDGEVGDWYSIQEVYYSEDGTPMAQTLDLQVEQALLKHPDSVVSNDAMYRSNTTWEDGNTVQNPSENVPDPYGAYNPMGDLTKKS